jgi:hypothetical protein
VVRLTLLLAILAIVEMTYRCTPLSSLIAPATLGIISMPDSRFYLTPVYEPTISDPDQPKFLEDYWETVRLRRMIDRIARVGQLPQLSNPKGLQNISYTTNLILPLVRCKPMDEKDWPWILDHLYERLKDPDVRKEGSMVGATISRQDLRVASSNHSIIGRIGYYASIRQSIDSAETSEITNMPELHIAIQNSSLQATHSVDYYTCNVHNASVTTEFTFINDVPSVQVIDILELAALPSWNSRVWFTERPNPLVNYGYFTRTLYLHLEGLVAQFYIMNGLMVVPTWDTRMAQEKFGDAKDFSAMSRVWASDDDYTWPDPESPPEKDLIPMFEEFALNASLALMTVPAFR